MTGVQTCALPISVPSSTFTTTVQNYLPRKDKIVLTKDRKILVLKGIPETTPAVPLDLPDAMTLYNVDIAPYTGRKEDIKLNYVENKRYTMRDIGKLEKRINRLEYYTALSFLEKIAADEKVASSIPGIDRFKNGIMVDSFGHLHSFASQGCTSWVTRREVLHNIRRSNRNAASSRLRVRRHDSTGVELASLGCIGCWLSELAKRKLAY